MRVNDEKLALEIARAACQAGGRAYFVGGYVRDRLMGIPGKDVDIEVFGIAPARLRALLAELGEPYDKGASFGVIGMRHTDIDVAMPRRESRAGNKHTDFDVSVDPSMPPPRGERSAGLHHQRHDARPPDRRIARLLGRNGRP